MPPLHTYGEQLVVPPSTHVPAPLHRSALLEFPPTQDAATHTVVAEWSAHEPEPEQNPVVPQVEAGELAHSLSGSVPFTMGPQTPFAPLPFFAAVQASHTPLQAVLQQTPSVQRPDAHCESMAHGNPLGVA
jgi:hypothetical protein